MTTVVNERQEKIKEIVCDILEIEPEDVTETSLFKEDHEADSLRAIEILASLEKEFHIEIDQADLGRMINLKSVYQIVSDTAGW